MNWKEITVNDKDVIDQFLAAKRYDVSDLTFTNFLIWHFSRKIEYTVVDDCLCVRVTYRGQPPLALMPVGTGDLKCVLDELVEDLAANGTAFRMRALNQDMVNEIKSVMGDRVVFEPESDHFDYVYRVSDLMALEGKAYHGKRNHINRFRMTYDFSYEPLNSDGVGAVKGAQIAWCQKRDCAGQQPLLDEHTGILEALDHFDALSFRGGILKVAGRVVAFTFGEALTDDTVVIHIEKADANMHGAYAMINQQFLTHEWSGMTYVNREEDLGIEGLRKAKQSYHPVKMVEKYTCRLRTDTDT